MSEMTDAEAVAHARELGTEEAVLGPGAKGDLSDPGKPAEPEVQRDPTEATRQELYAQAQDLDIPGRSGMSRDELEQAVAEAKGE